jgi:transposase-like protein
MTIFSFNDDSVEIACPRCESTSPRTTAWVRANDRYTCPLCDTKIPLDRDRQLARVDEPNAKR